MTTRRGVGAVTFRKLAVFEAMMGQGQFRNALMHGRLKAPEPIEWHDGSDPTSCQHARIFRGQIRLCLLLIQTIVERMVGDEIVEDSDFKNSLFVTLS